MLSFQLSITPSKSAAGRFISLVRRELQKAFTEEQKRAVSLSRASRE